MAFKLNLSKTYFTPVVVEVPMDGGRFEKMTFDAEFERLTREEFEELIEQQRKDGMTDRALLERVLKGWKKVVDEDGEDVPFSETGKQAVFSVVQAVPAIVKAFFSSMANVREKN